MNANTGQCYELPEAFAGSVGQPVTADLLPRVGFDELRAAVHDGEPIVAVKADVVQRLRLGDRELRRRARRS